MDLIFKILSFATFDTEYRTKREMFRKQIFKSPLDGLIYGGRYSYRVFTSFLNLVKQPDKNTHITSSVLIWFVIASMRVFGWVLKIVITFYDLLYVIAIGFINWGYYEESAMTVRSRPRRFFPHKQLVNYDYLYSHGNELINQYQM